jgi:hypothetical protein
MPTRIGVTTTHNHMWDFLLGWGLLKDAVSTPEVIYEGRLKKFSDWRQCAIVMPPSA